MLPILIGEIYKVMLCKKKHGLGPWDIFQKPLNLVNWILEHSSQKRSSQFLF